MRPILNNNNSEIERMAIFLLRRNDWSVVSVGDVWKDYNLELYKYNQKVAVKILNQRTKIGIGQIESFINFLSQTDSNDFTGGFVISTNGFTPSVYSYLREEKIENVKLATIQKTQLNWNGEEPKAQRENKRPSYFGVFTCKGGVGKTTIAAHLSGALGINGYDVTLLDLDKQRNLQKLLGKSVSIPTINNQIRAPIRVLNSEEWDEKTSKDIEIVVCDCNPEFEANPVKLIRKFDYCIIPTTLNPLGINKNADVIKRTFDAIRRENENAHLFVLINSLFSNEDKRNRLLNEMLKSQFKHLTESDDKCHYIDPNDLAIRFSKKLVYWGYHIIEQTKPTLAFNSIGGNSYPLMDFLKLADYLEMHTEIEKNAKSIAASINGL